MAARKKGLAGMTPLLIVGGLVAAYFVWKNSTPAQSAPAPAQSGGGGSDDNTAQDIDDGLNEISNFL